MLRFILKLTSGKGLGAAGFFPIPTWLHTYLKRLPLQRRVAIYAKLVIGVDLSFIAPNDVGCAEAVTRLLAQVDPALSPVTTGTYTLLEHLKKSTRFREVNEWDAKDGCVVIAATGTGFNLFPGHVGILHSKRVLSNNSYSGKWDSHWSLLAFKDYYQRRGGMKVRFFAVK